MSFDQRFIPGGQNFFSFLIFFLIVTLDVPKTSLDNYQKQFVLWGKFVLRKLEVTMDFIQAEKVYIQLFFLRDDIFPFTMYQYSKICNKSFPKTTMGESTCRGSKIQLTIFILLNTKQILTDSSKSLLAIISERTESRQQ